MKSWEILSDDDLVIYLHVFYWFVIIYTESQSEICAQKQSRIDGEMKCDRPVFDSPAVLGRPPWPSWLSASSLGPTGSTGSLSSASTAFPGVKGQRLWEGPKEKRYQTPDKVITTSALSQNYSWDKIWIKVNILPHIRQFYFVFWKHTNLCLRLIFI